MLRERIKDCANSVELLSARMDAFEERKHPRDEDGRFSGGLLISSKKSLLDKPGYQVLHGATASGVKKFVLNHHDHGDVGFAAMHPEAEFGGKRLSEQERYPSVQNVYVDPKHQRKGLASALYRHMERELGYKLKPSSGLHSSAGVSFWKSRGVDV